MAGGYRGAVFATTWRARGGRTFDQEAKPMFIVHCHWRATLAAFLLLVGAGRPAAQGTTGTISGTIVDESSQAVPGAAVTLIDERTTVSRSSDQRTRTAHSSFRVVPPGIYTVRVELVGLPHVRETRERAQRQQPALARPPDAGGRLAHRGGDRRRLRHAGRNREQRSHGAPDLDPDRADPDQGPRRDGACCA